MKLRLNSVFWDRAGKASAGLLTLLVATLAIPSVLSYVTSHPWITASAYGSVEMVLLLGVWLSNTKTSEQSKPTISPHSLQKTRMEIRYGTRADFPGMERVYDAMLDPEMEMADSDFIELLARGNLMRIMEEDFVNGSERLTRIVGYYSIWPLRKAEFDRIVANTLKEEDLKLSDIPSIDDPNVYALYLSEVCVSDETDSGATLMRDMLRYIVRLLNLHPNIETVAAWPYSDDGQEWVQVLRLKPCRAQWVGRKVHALDRRAALASTYMPSGQFKERLIVKY